MESTATILMDVQMAKVVREGLQTSPFLVASRVSLLLLLLALPLRALPTQSLTLVRARGRRRRRHSSEAARREGRIRRREGERSRGVVEEGLVVVGGAGDERVEGAGSCEFGVAVLKSLFEG